MSHFQKWLSVIEKPLTATYTFNFELWIFLHNVWFHIFQIYLVKQIDWISKPVRPDLSRKFIDLGNLIGLFDLAIICEINIG